MNKEMTAQLLNADLFKELGLEGISEEAKAGILDDAARIVAQGVIVKAMERLDPGDREAFAKLVGEQNDGVAIADFMARRVPHFGELLDAEIAAYKKMLVDGLKTA